MLCLLAWLAEFGPMTAFAVEFEDYGFDRFSQEITECDRLASHGRDWGHVAPAVNSSAMDKPAGIAACHPTGFMAVYNPTGVAWVISIVGR